jgi:hypothetical protein
LPRNIPVIKWLPGARLNLLTFNSHNSDGTRRAAFYTKTTSSAGFQFDRRLAVFIEADEFIFTGVSAGHADNVQPGITLLTIQYCFSQRGYLAFILRLRAGSGTLHTEGTSVGTKIQIGFTSKVMVVGMQLYDLLGTALNTVSRATGTTVRGNGLL